MDWKPIFLAGSQRSGTTLLYAIMGSHPNIALTRRTNFWEFFYKRFGDLNEPENAARCLSALKRYDRIAVLKPDWCAIFDEFWSSERTYARLFGLLEQQLARRQGKERWGDKSHNLERHAKAIFECYPNARVIHIIRDPRDRYVSARKADRVGRSGAAGGIAAWLWSVHHAKRNIRRYPNQYKVVQFESLVEAPEGTTRELCDFVEEEFSPAMLRMQGASAFRDRGGNSSFQSHQAGAISRSPVGRYRKYLQPRDLALMQALARREMRDFHYPVDPVKFAGVDWLRHHLVDRPLSWAMAAQWQARQEYKFWAGRDPSARRVLA
jgi:hypothetical protein